MPAKVGVTDYEVTGKAAEELEEALHGGAVPQIQLAYHVLFQGVCGNNADRHGFTLFNNVTVGDKSVVKGAARNFVLEGIVRKSVVLAAVGSKQATEESDRSKTWNEYLGTIDLIEETLREALSELFPRFASVFSSVHIVNYSVHGIGLGENSHMVSASVRFAYSMKQDDEAVEVEKPGKTESEKTKAVKCDGVDTVRASIECIVTFYNWMLWRLLRRERGLAKAKGEITAG